MKSRIFDMAAHEAKLERVVVQSFSASFMSNSKWRRAFAALSSAELGLVQLAWKFVGREHAVRGAVPDAESLGETYVRDVGFSVFPYKEIEWIEVPSLSVPWGYESLPLTHRPQNTIGAKKALEVVGHFEMTLSSEFLRVYGYR
jgi:hypothetical protein